MPTLNDPKNIMNFGLQSREILSNNSFFNQLMNKGKAQSFDDCVKMAGQYVNSFENPENPTLGKLAEAIQHFLNFQTEIYSAMEPSISLDERNRRMSTAMSSLSALTELSPSFETMVKDFAKNNKGIFSGDDGMRALNAMVQVTKSVSDTYNLAVSNEGLGEWKKSKDDIDVMCKEMTNHFDEFALECEKQKINPVKFVNDTDDIIEEEESQIQKLKDELAGIIETEEDRKHSEEYETLNKRVLENKDKLFKMNEAENALAQRKADLDEFIYKIPELKTMFKNAKEAADGRRRDIQTEERRLKGMEADVERLEGQNTVYKEAQEYLDTMGKLPLKHIKSMKLYMRDNKTIQRSLNIVDYIGLEVQRGKKAIDISDSYRKYRSADLELNEMDPEQRQAVGWYLEAKRGLLEYDASLQEDFKKFEDDPGNKIPRDFNKFIGDKLREKIKDNQTFIDQVQDTDYYKNYMKAQETVAKGAAVSTMLDFQKHQIEQKKQRIEYLKDELGIQEQRMQGIKNRVKEGLGDKCPDKIKDFNEIKEIAVQAKSELKTKVSKQNLAGINIIKAMNEDQRKMKALTEGLLTFKIAKLENQIRGHEKKLDKLKELGTKKEEMFKEAKNYAEKNIELQQKTSELKPKEPYEKLTERLEHIHKHFNDVQSFWSKGMSKTCRAMYDQLGATINALKDPSVGFHAKGMHIQTLAELSNAYIGAKNAQNRSKTFASDQRFWRLGFAEEMANMQSLGSNVIGKLQNNVNTIGDLDAFSKQDFSEFTKNPGRIVKGLLAHSEERNLAKGITNKGSVPVANEQPTKDNQGFTYA